MPFPKFFLATAINGIRYKRQRVSADAAETLFCLNSHIAEICNMSTMQKTIQAIERPNLAMADTIQAHIDDLTKPKGSLGKLEAIAMKYCLA